ncbi:MAG TPA: NUDIX domain-containing protein [Herpetosiphonaceae bacterium]
MINPDHEEGGRLGAVWALALLAACPLTCLFAQVVGSWWERCDIGINRGVRSLGLLFDVMPAMFVFFFLGGLAAVAIAAFRSWSARRAAWLAAAVLAAVFALGLTYQERRLAGYPRICGPPPTGMSDQEDRIVRDIRYQGAIVRDGHVLLLKHREREGAGEYWIIPGGGREEGESEEACVVREMGEETCLAVTVERLLFEEPGFPGIYQLHKTYLCRAEAGEALPGYEPEPGTIYDIAEARWFDLGDEAAWELEAERDAWTIGLIRRIRAALG